LACFIAFILLIADREKTGMPMRAAYLVFLAFECVGMAGAACGDLLTFTWLSLRVNAALAVMNISLALILAFRRTPTARVML
ncbi:hybrid sensor histidine kinase/response regulator, partial [Burkholderia sp. SIMBA_045]